MQKKIGKGGGKKEKEKREPRVTGGNGKTRIKRERKSMGRAGEKTWTI